MVAYNRQRAAPTTPLLLGQPRSDAQLASRALEASSCWQGQTAPTVACRRAQGDDIPPEEYTPEVLAELAPPEALHLLEPIVLKDYTTLPDSLQTAAYDIHTIDRFKYPFYQARLQHDRESDVKP